MNTVIELEGVTKTFGRHRAVDELQLVVPEGVIYGFIGPNGSGKTTTLRMILRILQPDAGRICVLGSASAGVANDRVGYLPEERGLYRKMRVRDVLQFFAELKGLRNPRPEVDRWLERFDLASWANKKVEALSKGMSQKVQFIAAVVAQPQIVILDEPFSGLDPVNRDVLKDAVLELRGQGATILFSTHDMAVAEQLCDVICMIFRGKKVLDGTLSSIQAHYGEDTIRVTAAEQNGTWLGLPGVTRVNDCGRYQELRLAAGADPQAILQELIRRTSVERFEIARPSLHDIFVRIAGPGAAEDKVPHA